MSSFPSPGGVHRIDKYRFATTTLDSAFNYEPLRWMLEGTNDATAAGGDAYDPYGMIKYMHTQRPTKPHMCKPSHIQRSDACVFILHAAVPKFVQQPVDLIGA